MWRFRFGGSEGRVASLLYVCGEEVGMTRLRAVAPLIVAAVLAGVAVFTVQHASCDDPGRYVASPTGYILVGGCIAPGDIVVKTPTPTPADADAQTKS